MTATSKKEIVENILELLIQLAEDDNNTTKIPPQTNKPVEMLTIKECAEVIQGLSEHTVRQLVAQDKVKHIRTGEGKRGKILVNKTDLIAYFQK